MWTEKEHSLAYSSCCMYAAPPPESLVSNKLATRSVCTFITCAFYYLFDPFCSPDLNAIRSTTSSHYFILLRMAPYGQPKDLLRNCGDGFGMQLMRTVLLQWLMPTISMITSGLRLLQTAFHSSLLQ